MVDSSSYAVLRRLASASPATPECLDIHHSVSLVTDQPPSAKCRMDFKYFFNNTHTHGERKAILGSGAETPEAGKVLCLKH